MNWYTRCVCVVWSLILWQLGENTFEERIQLICNQNGTETKATDCYNTRKVWFGYRMRQIERDRQRSILTIQYSFT